MDVIIFNNLLWLQKFRNNLQKKYKKMFYPNGKEFNELWEMYVDNYFKAKEIGLIILEESEYPIFIDNFLDNNSNDFTKSHKKKYKEFCEKMINTIKTIDVFLTERRN